MDRIIVAIILLFSGIVFPPPFFFPAYFTACTIVIIFYRISSWKSIIKFLILWFLFFFLVGMGRFFAGVNLFVLLNDCSFGLGLAIAISCALLLIVSDSPKRILVSLDSLKVSRSITYSFLSLLRLLPQVKSIGIRQLELLKLKTSIDGWRDRIFAYPRILGPLFTILLTQQYTHSRSLSERNFFSHKTIYNAHNIRIDTNTLKIIILIILNSCIWFGIWKWQH